MYKIFDTHAHYSDEAFKEDKIEIIKSLPEEGVLKFCEIGASMNSSKEAVALAHAYDGVYAAVGVHPDHVGTMTDEDFVELKKMAAEEKVVAIGEFGLDYHYMDFPEDVQKHFMRRQIELAKEVDLPVVIHSRDAAKDTMDIIKETDMAKVGGVIHCYSYGVEQAREYVDMGFFIGLGGVVTFKNARKAKEVALEIPLSSIVLETDCPYMAPTPYRGKRNYSGYLNQVAMTIAEIKGITMEEVCEVTYENAHRLYRIHQ